MLLNKKKFTLLSVLIGILVSIIFSAIYVLFFAGSEQKLALHDAVKVSQARQQQVQEFINFADHNINTLVHAVDFNNLAFHQNNSSFQAARKTLKVLINGVPDMAQIRLIDENGMEQIRFDRLRTNDQVVEATGPALQDKSKRYYFLDCINQSQSNRCYSVIDLNVENGAVEVPYVPTLRVSYLVKNQADKPFVLVINYYMAPFLQKLVEDSRYLTILADNLGNSVFSNYPDYQWSRQIKTQKGLQQIPEFSGYFEKFKVQNLLQTDDFVSRKLDVPIRDGLYLVYFFDPLLKQKTQNNQILFLLVISALTMILVFLLSLVYYRFLLGKRTINQIRSQEKLYSATFNNSAIGIAHIDLNGYILRAINCCCSLALSSAF
ncbi:hypothetical protein THIOSC15_2230003 [uncultured Thiomicrorhabdus sp.]